MLNLCPKSLSWSGTNPTVEHGTFSMIVGLVSGPHYLRQCQRSFAVLSMAADKAATLVPVPPMRPSEVMLFLSPKLCRSAHYWNFINLQGVRKHGKLFRDMGRRQSSLGQLELSSAPGHTLQKQVACPVRTLQHFLSESSFFEGYRIQNCLIQT